MTTTIIFCYPYRPPNGVSALFFRLADYLARNEDVCAQVIDFPDGFMARQLVTGCLVRLLPFSKDCPIEIPAGAILVLQADVPYRLRRQLSINPQAHVVYWQLHPFNFVPPLIPMLGHGQWLTKHPDLYRAFSGFLMPRLLRRVKAFVKLLDEKQSLYFMDVTCLRVTETYLGCKIPNPIFVPVVMAVPAEPVRKTRLRPNVLHVAWVGRLYDFKIHILVHTIQRFEEYASATGCSIVFHVIGSGPEEEKLAGLGLGQEMFELIRVKDLEWQDLHDYLVTKIDLVTAMGTAALEGAAIGLPVIALDFSYTPIKAPYRFRWLHETQGFDLGHPISSEDMDRTGDVLGELIAALQRDYSGLAAASYLYCHRHHSVAAVAGRFLELVRKTALPFEEIPRAVFRKSWVRRVYELARQ